MKTIPGLITVMIALASVVSTSCGRKPETVREEKKTTIVFFGDSVTNGYGVDEETESFYARIAKIMVSGMYGNVTTVNAGVNGDDTSEALRRVTRDVTSHNPDYVVIAFGLNDCQNRSITPEMYQRNIANMIAAMPGKTRVILATSNSFLETGQSLWKDLNDSLEPYMDSLRSLARERDLTLIDVHTAWENQLRQDQRHMETLYVDPTHPSAQGHRLIYEVYMNTLRRILR